MSGASSDLAYETMYDDDEILDQKEMMPWFDPNYLASKEEGEVSNNNSVELFQESTFWDMSL